MLFRPVAAQPVPSNFELSSSISKGHEAQNPENETNRLRADVFDRTNLVSTVSNSTRITNSFYTHINGLTIIPKPIPEINPFDIHFTEFTATDTANHEGEEGI